MTDVESEIDKRGRFSRNRRDSGFRNRARSTSREKSEERCHYCREPEHFKRVSEQEQASR